MDIFSQFETLTELPRSLGEDVLGAMVSVEDKKGRMIRGDLG